MRISQFAEDKTGITLGNKKITLKGGHYGKDKFKKSGK